MVFVGLCNMTPASINCLVLAIAHIFGVFLRTLAPTAVDEKSSCIFYLSTPQKGAPLQAASFFMPKESF